MYNELRFKDNVTRRYNVNLLKYKVTSIQLANDILINTIFMSIKIK